ncbi:MAG: T9SS type A sorting domain-containing protein [Melioribacteraceae bacterium]|nr:T9SS type A sorting domain-containing protein [Melioribacteraceae bacterium]
MKQIRDILIICLVITTNIIAQKIAGEQREIKEIVISSNEITTLLFNYGSISAPNRLGNIADMTWKGLGNMFEFGPLVAAEVIGKNGETLHITSDSFLRPFQGDYNYDGTVKWGWLPRAGFANPNNWEIANSLNPKTWPSDWNYWPGEYGDDVIIAENEVLYVIDDFTNSEFPYFPFPDDSTKRGLGVSIKVRTYQFGGFLKDALIIKYKLTNESPKDLSKVYFGFHGDPHIGGPSDYSDDNVGFLPNDYEVKAAANTIYNYDVDGSGDGGLETGYMSFKLLNTPNNLGLTSLHVASYTNSDPNVPRNDTLMWQWLSADSIDENQELLLYPGDNIINFGTGPFELNSGESKDIELAIFFSNDFNDMLQDAIYIQHYINWPTISSEYGTSGGNENYTIELTALQNINESNVEISWTYTGNNPDAKVFIDYSPNGGKDWMPIITDQNINENYIWDTKSVDDGVNYMLRVLAYNLDNPREFYFDNSNERFTINNPEKNAIPEFTFVEFSDTLRKEKAKVEWISEDADNSELLITVEHSTNYEDSFVEIFEAVFSNGDNSFFWDLSSIPNYETNYLRFTCKDNANKTVYISEPFAINVKSGVYSSSQLSHISGDASAAIELIVADTMSVTNDIYEITFNVDGETKKYSVTNLNTNQKVIDNLELIDGMSSPTFEGLRLNIKDVEMDIDYNQTHFNRSELDPSYNVYFSPSNVDYIGLPHVKSALDWIVVFNDLDTNSDGSWKNIGDSTLFVPSMKQGECPFKIIDLDNNEKANYLIDETRNPYLENNSWNEEELIILRPQGVTDATVSYALNFDFSSGIIPGNGDTLYIITYNPIDSNDVYQFTADDNYILSYKDAGENPNKFSLSQNYPNPFNPSTFINYSLPKSGFVELKVYDMLGREVASLVNKEQSIGNYKIEFNASNLTSGVYFYRISSAGFTKSMKMILLK